VLRRPVETTLKEVEIIVDPLFNRFKGLLIRLILLGKTKSLPEFSAGGDLKKGSTMYT
jgi:hypothetical protein